VRAGVRGRRARRRRHRHRARRLGGGARDPGRLPARVRRAVPARPRRRRPLLPHQGVLMPLSILIWLPVVASLIGAVTGPKLAPRVTLVGAFAALGISIGYLASFKTGGGLQWVTDETWIATLGVHYKIGIDGLNLALIMLTTIVWAAVMLWANFSE